MGSQASRPAPPSPALETLSVAINEKGDTDAYVHVAKSGDAFGEQLAPFYLAQWSKDFDEVCDDLSWR